MNEPSVQIALHYDDGKNMEEKFLDTTLEIADTDDMIESEITGKIHA